MNRLAGSCVRKDLSDRWAAVETRPEVVPEGMLRRVEPGMIDALDEMSSIQGPAALRKGRNGMDYVKGFVCQIPQLVNGLVAMCLKLRPRTSKCSNSAGMTANLCFGSAFDIRPAHEDLQFER